MKWTNDQQRKYRAQVKELGLGDDERRDLLRRLTGRDSTALLNRDEMTLVINEQDRLLGHDATEPHHASQDEMIHAIEHRLGWDDNPHRLQGFIRRQTHGRKENLGDLDRMEKVALIEALKGVRMHLHRESRRDDTGPAADVHPSN